MEKPQEKDFIWKSKLSDNNMDWVKYAKALEKYIETTKPVNVDLAAVIKCGECKPMEYWIEGIRYYKCQLCGEPM
jgi:hypothetical protein